MTTNRLEAFSDGVIAIIITIMVLELELPHGDQFGDIKPVIPTLLAYVLSFIYVGIYWNNHHHLFHAAEKVSGKVLWANLFLLFWLSLVPFATRWLGENPLGEGPVIFYGICLLMAAIAYYILSHFLINVHGKDSALSRAFGKDIKGKLSVAIYVAAILFGFIYPVVSIICYIVVAIAWVVPDARIEKSETKIKL